MGQAGGASKKYVGGASKYGGVSATAYTEKALSLWERGDDLL